MTTADVPVPVERFKPTGGMFLGWGSLGLGVGLIVLVAVSEPNLVGVRVCLSIAVVALLVWMTLLRPRAAAYDDRLVLRNMASDTHLPLAGIDAVLVRTTLNVWMEGERYVCVGIGRSTRKLVNQRGRGPMAVLGLEHDDHRYAEVAKVGASLDYATFVENRIAELALAARRRGDQRPPVRREWARPELAALGVLVVALVATFVA